MSRITRRKILAGASAFVLSSRFALAQAELKSVRIGILYSMNRVAASHLIEAFEDELAKNGWREKVNVEYIAREANGDLTRLDSLAAELLALKPDVTLGTTAPVVRALKRHTSTMPIIFAVVPDPVGSGFAASLARPGGNTTGMTTRFEGMWGKRLQLLKEAAPSVRRVGIVFNPTDSQDNGILGELRPSAKELQVELREYRIDRAEGFAPAFAAMKPDGVEAALLGSSILLFLHRRLIADLAITHRVPAIAANTEGCEAGALLSYSADLTVLFRNAGRYVDRVLRGARPGDLPIVQPTVLELAVNKRTANALALPIPQSILLRASRVIG